MNKKIFDPMKKDLEKIFKFSIIFSDIRQDKYNNNIYEIDINGYITVLYNKLFCSYEILNIEYTPLIYDNGYKHYNSYYCALIDICKRLIIFHLMDKADSDLEKYYETLL